MAQSYAQIQERIARLQSEAQTLRQSEVADVISRIKDAIRVYELTQTDLFGGKAAGTARGAAGSVETTSPQRAAKKAGKARRGAKPGYTDGVNTWSGFGRKPGWLVQGLARGKKLEDFLA